MSVSRDAAQRREQMRRQCGGVMPEKNGLLLCLGGAALLCGLMTGPVWAGSTARVSVDSGGIQGASDSYDPSVSADGRFVAFYSFAANLVGGDTNGVSDIFVHDRQTGATERVSIDSLGTEADASSSDPAISADGRFVAFQSYATNLVAGDTNGFSDVFVHDRQTGATERVSVDDSGAQAVGGDSFKPSISADGRFVAFECFASNLVAGDTNGDHDIFVHDRATGATERVSIDSSGSEADGQSLDPAISGDGRFMAFVSYAANLIAGDTNGIPDILVHDRQSGATERVSVSSAGIQANSPSSNPVVSADGRFVAFESYATNLVAGDTNGYRDIFVHDRQTGATERVSVGSNGAQASSISSDPAISADGRFVAFESFAANLIAWDANTGFDVFVRDRRYACTTRVSRSSTGRPGNIDSHDPSISGDGRFVAFYSDATNLVPGDTNASTDIFVRDQRGRPINDLLVDFGPAGLWQYLDNATWRRIHNASPDAIASGDLDGSGLDEVIASFSGAGIWVRYNDTTWVKLHPGTPKYFVTGDFDGNGEADLVIDFGAAGIWVKRNNAGWAKLHGATSQGLAVGDLDGNGSDELIVDFGGAGLWARYNDATWKRLHYASPTHIATGDLDGSGQDEVIGDFGSLGLLALYNNGQWAYLRGGNVQALSAGDVDANDADELIVGFGAAGLWVRYDYRTWVKQSGASPRRVVAANLDDNCRTDLVLDFGPAGLWARFNNATWVKLHAASAQDFVVGAFD